MSTLVIAIHIIVCLVLIIVILLQAGRGQGLTGAGFGGNVQSLLGTKASSFLTKATSICAILFLFTCIGLNIIEIKKSQSIFKAPGTQAPLDVDQIKKALEKIKTTDVKGAATAAKTDAKAAATAATQAAGDAAKAVTVNTQAAGNAVKVAVDTAAKAETKKS